MPNSSNPLQSKLATLNQIQAISWNANGLCSHLPELLNFLDSQNISPSFICIQETWLYNELLPDIPGYNYTHSFRTQKSGGGSAIYIKDCICFSPIKFQKFEDIEIEVAGVQFLDKNSLEITLISVYIAPGQNLTTEHLNQLLISKNLIMVGDFNAKHNIWGSPVNDYRGKMIERFIENNNLVCLNNGEPTRMHFNGSLSHLDLIIASQNLAFKIGSEVLNDQWGSDHYPLTFNYNESIVSVEINCNKFDYKKANWKNFQDSLADPKNYSYPLTDVNTGYTDLTSAYRRARDNNIPLHKGIYNHKYSPYWSPECSKAKLDKKNAEKNLRKNKTLENQILLRKLKAKFKYILGLAKKQYWNKFCSSLNQQTKLKNVWDTISKLKGTNIKNKKILIKDENGILLEDQVIADKLAKNFDLLSSDRSVNTTIINSRPSTVKESLNNRGKALSILSNSSKDDSRLINDKFTRTELNNVLSQVNLKSAPGSDEIPFIFFKHSPNITIDYLLDIINNSWQNNLIPIEWKSAIITPILKPNKNRNDINSYRPISLTNTTSKIIEKMIVYRLNWYLEKNNLLSATQAGFRKGFCTKDPIIRLTREADTALKSGNITIAIMIDFTRAFDLIWTDGLLLKLRNLNVPGNMINWIKNFLSNRTYKVKVGSSFSSTFTPDNGTPQGSSLSPILFLIMVNDFPILSKFTSNAFLADDCTIWRSGLNLNLITFHLQQDLEIISQWCIKWGFSINTSKTTGIVFSNQKINTNQILLKLDNKKIDFGNTCKLLGVVMDSHMTWRQHIDYLLEKSSRSLNIMRCLSGTLWGSNKKTLLILYKSLILSNFDYCCFTYMNACYSNIKRLDTVQYKALLIATGGLKGTALNALIAECGEIPLSIRRDKILIKYLLNLQGNNSNRAKEVLEDKKYFQLETNNKSVYSQRLNSYLVDINCNLRHFEIIHPSSPFVDLGTKIDLTFLAENAKIYNNETNPVEIQITNIVTNLIATFDQVFFADGSVAEDGKVGAAFFSPTLPISKQFKLPKGLSVYYSESFAILQAIQFAIDQKLEKFCILSDSLLVIQHIKFTSYARSPHPIIINNICNLIRDLPSDHFHLKWIPGHSNYHHTLTADSLAKLSSLQGDFYPITFTRYEAVLMTEGWSLDRWQKEWEKEPKTKYQRTFSLRKGKEVKFKSRKAEKIINRFKLLQTKLNAGMKKIGQHPTGLCDACSVSEDSFHFLISCTKTSTLRDKLRDIQKLEINQSNYQKLLNDTTVQETIVNFVLYNHIAI